MNQWNPLDVVILVAEFCFIDADEILYYLRLGVAVGVGDEASLHHA